MQTLQTTQDDYYEQTSNTTSVRGYHAPKVDYIWYTTYTNVLVYYTVFNLQQIDKLIEFSS